VERIKKRFNALYDSEDVGEVDSCIGQIKGELKFFYSEKYRGTAEPMLDFIEMNSNVLLTKGFLRRE